MVDRIIKVFCLIALISANTLLLGISYQLDSIDKKLNRIELINDIAIYK
jgi:hypothetical protein